MAGIEVTGKYKNKVIYGTTVLVDLTADTVTKDTLKKGATAHDASGEPITGTLTIPGQQVRTVDLNMPSGNQTITPDNGKVLSKVTVTKPTTMIPANIKKDVNIGGVVGTLETTATGVQSETWVWDDGFYFSSGLLSDPITIDFESNGITYHSIRAGMDYDTQHLFLYYDDTVVAQGTKDGYMFFDEDNHKPHRKMIFSKPITEETCEKLYYQFTEGGYDGEPTAVKQPSNIALQPSKSVEIIANGTTTVTPDVPYDALGQVNLAVNIGGDLPNKYIMESYEDNGDFKIDFIGVTHIRQHQFYFSKELKEISGSGWNGIKEVGDRSFQGCSNLKVPGVPSSIEKIGNYAFQDTTFIEPEQIFPEGLTSIGTYAFWKTRGLKTITLPSTLKDVKANAFKDCPDLTTVIFKSTPAELIGNALASTSIRTIKVPWAEGAVKYAPWGATLATVIYNFRE